MASITRKGGLVFFRIGRFGGSVYLAKAAPRHTAPRQRDFFGLAMSACLFLSAAVSVAAAPAGTVFDPADKFDLEIYPNGNAYVVERGISGERCDEMASGIAENGTDAACLPVRKPAKRKGAK